MKYWLQCIFLCVGCLANNISAQVSDAAIIKLKMYGDSLYNAGNYYEAALSFDRAAFFSSSIIDKANLLLKKSDAYKQLADYENAELAFSGLDFSKLGDSLMLHVKYEAAYCAYLSGYFEKAESHLEQLNSFVSDSGILVNSYLLNTLILNEEGKWQEAKKHLVSYVNKSGQFSDTAKKRMFSEIDNLYSSHNLPSMKNINKASHLSMVIPGLGQMYAGYFWEGAGSFALSAATLGLTAFGIYQHYYITSILFGFATFERFYIGNNRRAEFLAKKTNYKRKKACNEKLKAYIVPYFK